LLCLYAGGRNGERSFAPLFPSKNGFEINALAD